METQKSSQRNEQGREGTEESMNYQTSGNAPRDEQFTPDSEDIDESDYEGDDAFDDVDDDSDEDDNP